MGLIQEFKQFAMQGNVVDLAVGVVIGGAFGKIVTSIVGDLVMPLVGLVAGGVNFTSMKLVLKPEATDAAGKMTEAVTLNYGNFLQSSFDFLMVALAIFAVIKAMNSMRKPTAGVVEEEVVIVNEIGLLTEIRDALKAKA